MNGQLFRLVRFYYTLGFKTVPVVFLRSLAAGPIPVASPHVRGKRRVISTPLSNVSSRNGNFSLATGHGLAIPGHISTVIIQTKHRSDRHVASVVAAIAPGQQHSDVAGLGEQHSVQALFSSEGGETRSNGNV